MHSIVCGLELLILLGMRAPTLWFLLLVVCAGAVIAFELANTALENAVDHLHPERHPSIGAAKDCAAGAVLLMSLISGGITVAFLVARFTAHVEFCR